MEADSSPSLPPPPPPVDPNAVSVPPPPAFPPPLPPLATLTFSNDNAHYRKALEIWRYRVDDPSSEGGWALEVRWGQLNRGEEPFELRAGVFVIAGNPYSPPPGAVYYKPVKLDDLRDIYEGEKPHPFIMSMLSPIERQTFEHCRAEARDTSIDLQSALSDAGSVDEVLQLFKDRLSDVNSILSIDSEQPSIYDCLTAQLGSQRLASICAIGKMVEAGSELIRARSGSFEPSNPPSIAPPSTNTE